MKKLLSRNIVSFTLCVLMIFCLAACGNNNRQTNNNSSTPASTDPETSAPIESEDTSDTSEPSAPEDVSSESQPEEPAQNKTLVVFFSMPDNVDDSTVVINGETLGNTQYMAYVIQQNTDADIFRIKPETPYPTDHETHAETNQQIKAITNQTNKLTIAQKASATASKLMNTGLNLITNIGVAFFINSVITGISKLVNKQNELIESAKQSARETTEYIDSLDDIKNYRLMRSEQ